MSDHPLKVAPLRIFRELGSPHVFLGFFGSTAQFPLLFHGCSAEDVRARAEAWRQATLEKHEGGFHRRRAAAEARRKRKVSGEVVER